LITDLDLTLVLFMYFLKLLFVCFLPFVVNKDFRNLGINLTVRDGIISLGKLNSRSSAFLDNVTV